MDEELTEPWSPDELMRVNGIPCVYTYWIGRYWVHLPGMPDALSLDQLSAYGYNVVMPKFPRNTSKRDYAQQKEFRRISADFRKKAQEMGV